MQVFRKSKSIHKNMRKLCFGKKYFKMSTFCKSDNISSCFFLKEKHLKIIRKYLNPNLGDLQRKLN